MLRIGILGAARIAPTASVKPASRTGRVVVTAVAARDRTKAETVRQQTQNSPSPRFLRRPHRGPRHRRRLQPPPERPSRLLDDRGGQGGQARPVREALHRQRRRGQDGGRRANIIPGLVVMEAFHYEYHPLAKRLVEIVDPASSATSPTWTSPSRRPSGRRATFGISLALAGGATMDVGCTRSACCGCSRRAPV